MEMQPADFQFIPSKYVSPPPRPPPPPLTQQILYTVDFYGLFTQ